jgi:hypothetical protein
VTRPGKLTTKKITDLTRADPISSQFHGFYVRCPKTDYRKSILYRYTPPGSMRILPKWWWGDVTCHSTFRSCSKGGRLRFFFSSLSKKGKHSLVENRDLETSVCFGEVKHPQKKERLLCLKERFVTPVSQFVNMLLRFHYLIHPLFL